MPVSDRGAIRAAVYAAAANWLVVILGVIVISIVKDEMFTRIPLLFKLWLVVPIIAFVAGIYLLYRFVVVWRQGQLAGTWARVRYSIVALSAALVMTFMFCPCLLDTKKKDIIWPWE